MQRTITFSHVPTTHAKKASSEPHVVASLIRKKRPVDNDLKVAALKQAIRLPDTNDAQRFAHTIVKVGGITLSPADRTEILGAAKQNGHHFLSTML